MTEVLRYSQIGFEDVKTDPRDGRFEVTLADGRVVLLSALDVPMFIRDAYARANLPVGIVGRQARVTDNVRGIWTYGSTGTTGTWFPMDNVINARWFGLAGDGVQDDAVPINAAIEAASAAGGGVVYVPGNGVAYRCVTQVVLKSNVFLVGAGVGATILENTNFNGPSVRGVSLTNTGVRDLTIQGTGNVGASTMGLDFNGCSKVWVDSVYIHTFEFNGLRFLNAGMGSIITNCLIERCDVNGDDVGIALTAAFSDQTDCVIANNRIRDTNGPAILLDTDSGAGTGGPGLRLVVSGNQVDYTSSNGISVHGCRDVAITGNVLTRIGQRGTVAVGGIRVTKDNGALATIPGRVVISGNMIAGCSGDGVQLQGASDCLVSGNMIYDIGTTTASMGVRIYASTVTGSFRNMVMGNYFNVPAPNTGMSHAVFIDADSDHNYIGPNGVYRHSTSPMVMDSGDENIVDTQVDMANGVAEAQPTGVRPVVDHSTVTHTGTTSITTLKTFGIGTDLMGATGKLRIKFSGNGTGTAGTKTITLQFGTTSVAVLTSGAAAGEFYGEVEIDNTTRAAQRWHIATYYGSAVNNINGSQTSTEDTSAVVTVNLRGTLGNSGDSIVLRKFEWEIVR